MTYADREAFARRWADAISGTSYVSMARGELVAHLVPLTKRLVQAALAAELDPSAGRRVGADLVSAHFTSTDTLSATLTLIVEALPDLLGRAPPGIDVTSRVARLSAAAAAGYADALRERSLDEQDSIYRAGLRARRQAEQALASSESRFRQVFYSSPLGLAISEPGGTIVQCNRALEDILDYPPGDLVGRDLSELFLARDRPVMQERYRSLVTGRDPRLRIRFPLRGADGEPVWANLDVSVLPDGEHTAAEYLVTMVDDITDLQLLEQRLHHQTLHDPQTGLPNRQYLITHLERVLTQLDPTTVLTLMHLDLDGFSVINDGLGQHIGDQMLAVVAHRLESLVADRPGMVARVGDDEFAVFLESGDPVFEAGTLVEMINDELAEPHYVDKAGLALTATIGVVQRPASECVPDELIRDASATLRQLRNQGPGRWARFNTGTDALDRAELRLAAEIPGAQETGQLEVTYQSVVDLADHQLVGIEAALRWVHPGRGTVSHQQCIAAAERTGAIRVIGAWWLSTAAKQAVAWQQRTEGAAPPMMINLAPTQAQHPELISTLGAVLDETGLPPTQLELRAPVGAIRTITGGLAGAGGAQAEHNLRELTELGLRVGVYDFAGGIGALRCVADLPLSSVRLAAAISEPAASTSILDPAVRTVIRGLRAAGVDVIAYPIDTAAQAEYCAGLGANWALGALYGRPGPAEQLDGLPGT